MKRRQGSEVINLNLKIPRFHPLLTNCAKVGEGPIGIILDDAVHKGGTHTLNSTEIRKRGRVKRSVFISMLASEFQGQGAFCEW